MSEPTTDGANLPPLPAAWQALLHQEFAKPYWKALQLRLAEEWATQTILPARSDVFAAFEFTPPEAVRVLILGQDPYPTPGQAHGLSFSVRRGTAIPASLRNIFRELLSDLGVPSPATGCLTSWARQGVLLLNSVLTVRAGQANSHKGLGWESFTDAVIRVLNAKIEAVVFVLWGAQAQKKAPLIDSGRHVILQSAHPSPLSARTGFFGSRPFSQINSVLASTGQPVIDWRPAED